MLTSLTSSIMDTNKLVIQGQDFVNHSGVRGMHWGIRNKSKSSPGTKTSADARVVNMLKGKPRHTLSNKQLRTLNERGSLEKNYSSLNPHKIRAGLTFVAEGMAAATLLLSVNKLIGNPAGKAITAIGKKAATRML